MASYLLNEIEKPVKHYFYRQQRNVTIIGISISNLSTLIKYRRQYRKNTFLLTKIL